jgi:membrane-associated phospholipid phosphatase
MIKTPPDPELETPQPEAEARSQRFVGLTLLAGIIAALIVLALLSWMAHEMLEGETVHFDDAVRNGVHLLAGPGTTRVMRAISLFGGPTALAPLGVLIALWFLHRGWHRAAALLPLTLIGAALLDGVLKFSFARARPTPFFDYPLPTSYSFPSGHAMFGFCFFTVLAALLSPRLQHTSQRTAVWALAIGASFLVGLSRIYLGVHYPSDVVAGWGAGFVWVVIVAFGDRVAHRIKHGLA